MQSIKELVQPYIDDHSILGVAVALIQKGIVVDVGAYGKTSVDENGLKVTQQTVFAYLNP